MKIEIEIDWWKVKDTLSVVSMVGCLAVTFVAVTGVMCLPLCWLMLMWACAVGLGFLSLYLQN